MISKELERMTQYNQKLGGVSDTIKESIGRLSMFVIIAMLFAYAPIELTRVILVAGNLYWTDEKGFFLAELVAFWGFYFLGLLFVWKLLLNWRVLCKRERNATAK